MFLSIFPRISSRSSSISPLASFLLNSIFIFSPRSNSNFLSSNLKFRNFSTFAPVALPFDPPIVTSKGRASRSLSWSEVSHWIAVGSVQNLGGRSAVEHSKYVEHRKFVAEEWNSLDDFIKNRYLQQNWKIDPETGKKCAIEENLINNQSLTEIKKQKNSSIIENNKNNNNNDNNNNSPSSLIGKFHVLGSARLVLTRNEFPYFLEFPIEHWLIWSDQPLNDDQLSIASDYYFPSSEFETLGFVNPPHLRSVKSVFHAHVFARPVKQNIKSEESKLN